MSDDWQVGDKALCIRSAGLTNEGSVYTVTQIIHDGTWCEGVVNMTGADSLRFAEVVHKVRQGWDSNRFRKIRPDKHEFCEEEFRALLKRSKRRVEA